MANLDSRFITTSDIDTYFVSNQTGLPLAGGIVTFYSDVNRTTLKPVYQLTGTPGNYTYAPLPNPITLSSSGTYQDGLGNNIVPYYYPFTSTPAANTGIQELYYITCVDSGFSPQFVRQGWPQAAGSGNTPASDAEIENYIPNGQFLAHNNIVSVTEPPITQYTFGSQTLDAQAIAQGGWYFVYTDANTAVFNNSFQQIPASGGWGMNSFPKFIFNFVCSQYNANALTRALQIQWRDVNKFSSGNPPGNTSFTLFFDARSNDGNTYTFTLNQVFYYGTGGTPSAPVVTPIATFSVGPSMSFVSQNIQNIAFAPNQGTIGTNGDDYVALQIQGPPSAWNVAFTDFALVEGSQNLTSFPIETNAEMLAGGVAGWMPTPDPTGLDLYLPLILTPQGMVFDRSEIGEIWGTINRTLPSYNHSLFCDGSVYVTSAYSSIGIPYSRLQAILFNTTYNVPMFGTGATFAQIDINSGATSQMILATNLAGSQTNPADGTTATGFTFTTTAPLSNAGHTAYGYKCFSNINGVVNFISTFSNGTHSSNNFAAGTSGMTFNDYNDASVTGPIFGAYTTALAASALAAGTATPGLYFTFSNHTIDYYVWFYVNGETDPAPGGTGIRCNLISTMAIIDVGNIIASVVNGQQTNAITTVAASNPIPDKSYFTFFANSQQYTVWYQVASTSVAPVVAGTIAYIQVTLLGTETAIQVATKTQIAINSYQFAVPDLRGVFLRGTDGNPVNWDLDQALRWSYGRILGNSTPGSFEFNEYTIHNHPGSSVISSNTQSTTQTSARGSTSAGTPVPLTIIADGGTETRPTNMYVDWYIKY